MKIECVYPECKLGKSPCPNQNTIFCEHSARVKSMQEQKARDIAEQETRIRLLNEQADALERARKATRSSSDGDI